MPWHIEEGYESCSGFAVIKDSDGSVAGCHETEEAAKKQLAALYASEPEARAAKYDHINFKPPSGVRSEAQRGLDWRSEFGRGGTGVGIARARDLSNGVTISPDTARRMKAFFDRHQSDKNAEGWSPGEKGFPSNGRIAHALWGGDAGYAWSRKLVRQMNSADEARSVREFLETRGFCSTGSGGGIDNSCSSKGGGGDSSGSGPSPKFSKTPPSGWDVDDDATGAITAKFGSGGPGVDGETHHGYVGYNKYATPKTPEGWTAEVVRLSPRGGQSGGKSTSKDGFKTRDEAAAWATTQAAADFGSLNKPSGGAGKKKRSHEMQVETRSLCLDDFSEDDAFPLLKIERRCEQEGGEEEAWLVGYAARFGATSLKMDDFYERIAPEAFGIVTERRGRKSPLETRALFNHDPNHLLGRYPSTLRMKVDEHGLRYEIKMPASQRGLVESIERGDIRGSSFSFIISPGGEEWTVEEGRSIRTVKSIASLIDVGPVTFPAYPDASVAVARRSYDEFIRGRSARSAEIEAIRSKKSEIEKFLRERGR
jgi:HK97 family phage prohead protease